MDLKFNGLYNASDLVVPMSEMKAGNIYTLDLVSQDEILAYVDKISMRDQEHVLLLSRLPQRRLIEHIDLDKVEGLLGHNSRCRRLYSTLSRPN